MYLFAVFAALIAAISPFAGLIFTTVFGIKFQSKIYVFLSVFMGSTAILYFGGFLEMINALDILFGVGIICFLFIRNFLATFNYLKSLLLSAVAIISYGIVRQILFYDTIVKMTTNYLIEYNKMLVTTFENNPKQLELMQEVTSQVKLLFTDFYVGVWSIMMISALYIAALIISTRSIIKWQLKTIQMPFNLIYVLIIALVAFLIPNTQKYGINGFMIIAPFFLIEGISILQFHWGEYFKRSKFLLIILILAIAFNPYLLMLIILLGILDIWFNFRKIRNGGSR